MNSIANILGRAICGLTSIVAAPIVIAILGAEAYGIVSFALTLQAFVAIFDMGLAATVKRELAGSIAQERPARERTTILRTFEVAYWTAALIVGTVLVSIAPFFAQDWLKLDATSPSKAANALQMAAVVVALRWPVALYGGVLLVLKTQIQYNIYNSLFFGIRTLGAVVALNVFPATLHTYFCWFIGVSIIEAVAFVFAAWKSLGLRNFFLCSPSWSIITRSWQFSVSFSMVGAIGMVAAAMDRFILGSRTSMAALGAYTLASTPAGMLTMAGAAVSTAFFPEAVGLWATGRRTVLAQNLMYSIGRIFIAISGVTIILSFAADDIMLFWLGDKTIAMQAARCLPWLAFAFFLNALANPSYTLLISCGHTRLPLIWNTINLLASGIAMYLLAPSGAQVIAMIIAASNACGLLIMTSGALRLTGLPKGMFNSLAQAIIPLGMPVMLGAAATVTVNILSGGTEVVLPCILAFFGVLLGMVRFEKRFGSVIPN